jgi:hypothetical protein
VIFQTRNGSGSLQWLAWECSESSLEVVKYENIIEIIAPAGARTHNKRSEVKTRDLGPDDIAVHSNRFQYYFNDTPKADKPASAVKLLGHCSEFALQNLYRMPSLGAGMPFHQLPTATDQKFITDFVGKVIWEGEIKQKREQRKTLRITDGKTEVEICLWAALTKVAFEPAKWYIFRRAECSPAERHSMQINMWPSSTVQAWT